MTPCVKHGNKFLLGTLAALFCSGFVCWFQGDPRGDERAVVPCAGLLVVMATVACALLPGRLFDLGERPTQALPAGSAMRFVFSGMPWLLAAMPQPLASLAQALLSTAGVQAMVKANQMHVSMAAVAPERARSALGYGALAAYRLLRRPVRSVAVIGAAAA